MSFTTEVAGELISLPLKKTCCRRAFLLGTLLCARETDKGYECYFYEESTAVFIKELLKKTFHSESILIDTVRVGRRTFILSFESNALSEFFNSLGRSDSLPHVTAGFRCGVCQQAFVRGAIVGSASISDPQKGYHFEMLFPRKESADFIAGILESIVGLPNRIKRGNRFGVYYKNNGAILDLLYFTGCNRSSMYMANSFIERDIRNNENRATNCVTRNILRSVDSAQKQINAIERLIETRKIESLSDELRYTAKLRLENESATLSELAALHETPISKSGLNRRLTKLMEAAEEQ